MSRVEQRILKCCQGCVQGVYPLGCCTRRPNHSSQCWHLKKKGAIINTKASLAIMGIISVAWPSFLCKSPALSWNVSRHHSTLRVSFISYVGRPFHLFIPFNLFTVTKQNLLIFSKAPSESLYAHSVAFSHSYIHTHTSAIWTAVLCTLHVY